VDHGAVECARGAGLARPSTPDRDERTCRGTITEAVGKGWPLSTGQSLLFHLRSRPSPVQVGCSLVSADGGRLEPVPAPDDKGWVAQSWSPDGGTIVL